MKKNKHNIFDVKLDEYEQEISEGIDQTLKKGSLKNVDNIAEELAFAKEAAASFLCKDARVTLRLSSGGLARLKQKAAYK